ncbi:GTPase HflX [Nitrososphaera viennensis]|uniref:GTPase HflX n=2 Tax=Nitrososphaera viennensis TaxID=1034015 RepID=A0A060HSE7_9ARCH|nr:GTPase HflX [Nitrososphaera viennensis]AIC16087.1 putative GTP-binding protein [Nitrososphaera viennensis EN76]UVS70638.1 GTPase HflX [Nitrososphaera viennensis]
MLLAAAYRKAILITYPYDEAISEAVSLADAAGYRVEKIVTQKHITKSRYGIGRGKAEEVKAIAEEIQPEVIVFDEVLKPSQTYNLASVCKKEVIDRERLILEIFERRASTTESKTQIKLAQLRYDMTRAREAVRLAKAGEQPGFYGLGKYEADTYLLDIKNRAQALKKKLEKEVTKRQLHRNQRAKAGLMSVSLAGYTSAGKTTLFNALTGETKSTAASVFTTLSTFTRAIDLDGDKVLLLDTVGFISKLPAYMIDAFKSTLEELSYASLVFLVIDISEPVLEIRRKLASSLEVIREFEVPETRIVYVLNKVDRTTVEDAFDKAGQLGLLASRRVLPVSAKTGYNMDQLKSLARSLLFETERVVQDDNEKTTGGSAQDRA